MLATLCDRNNYTNGNMCRIFDLVLFGAQNHVLHTEGQRFYDAVCFSPASVFVQSRTQGVIPVSFHMDGAEFYRDTEFNVWSMSSILSAGDVTLSFLSPMCPFMDIYGFRIPSINLSQFLTLHRSFKVMDIKFPVVILPHSCMTRKDDSWLHLENQAVGIW